MSSPGCNLIYFIRPPTLNNLVGLFTETVDIKSAQKTEAEDPDEVLRSIDFEEQGVGYQAAYSKLAASQTVVDDPVAFIGNDLKTYVGGKIGDCVKKDPRVKGLVGMADAGVVGPFLTALGVV